MNLFIIVNYYSLCVSTTVRLITKIHYGLHLALNENTAAVVANQKIET